LNLCWTSVGPTWMSNNSRRGILTSDSEDDAKVSVDLKLETYVIAILIGNFGCVFNPM